MAAVLCLFEGKRKALALPQGYASPVHQALAAAVVAFKLSGSPPHAHYQLAHKRRPLDLSLTLLQAGVSNNATVELMPLSSSPRLQSAAVAAPVRLALVLPSGQRLVGTATPSQTLRAVLRAFSAQHPQTVPAIDDTESPNQVSLMFMRQCFAGPALDSTTLAAIGLNSGSAVFTVRVAAGAAAPPVSSSTAPVDAMETDEPAPSLQSGPGFPEPTPLLPSEDATAALDEQDELAANVAKLEAAKAAAVAEEDYAKAAELKAALAALRTAAPAAPPVAAAESHSAGSRASSALQLGNAGPVPPPAAVGLPAFEVAVATVCRENFDEDARQCLLTLIRYVTNLLKSPHDERPRSIRRSNKVLNCKVTGVQGGLAALYAVGFVPEERGLPHELARDRNHFTFLVLAPEVEDRALLVQAHRMLTQAGASLGLAAVQLPAVPPPPSATFDPYKSTFTTTSDTPQLRAAGGPSITEQRLAQLQQKKAQIAGGIPSRNLHILPPAATAAPSALRGSGGGSAALSASELNEDPTDLQLVAGAVARQMAERRREEQVPFRTRATRELERLANTTVFSHTLIRLQFADRTTASAAFHPDEPAQALVDLLAIVLEAADFEIELFTTPPRRTLDLGATLSSLGLVPAAVVHVSVKLGPTSAASSSSVATYDLLNEAGRSPHPHTATFFARRCVCARLFEAPPSHDTATGECACSGRDLFSGRLEVLELAPPARDEQSSGRGTTALLASEGLSACEGTSSAPPVPQQTVAAYPNAVPLTKRQSPADAAKLAAMNRADARHPTKKGKKVPSFLKL